ncbi:hypothetical protein O1Q96_00905 (plasmid) [Streptomyces sp. Qhu-G9]|uniref:hypothetical protein n=1 Tax=Streptomyces sp. Qhu-G9 TaxID=3452799 RepID=UPI0022ABD944|nr:hypothetical protein [Streptomyces aurantiacus]WAU78433.1 hypothetical protein O1Q96_00905 [Streptomyces aurantiacus]
MSQIDTMVRAWESWAQLPPAEDGDPETIRYNNVVDHLDTAQAGLESAVERVELMGPDSMEGGAVAMALALGLHCDRLTEMLSDDSEATWDDYRRVRAQLNSRRRIFLARARVFLQAAPVPGRRAR